MENFRLFLGQAGFLVLLPTADDDLIPVASNSDVTRTIEEDHRAWVFVDRGLVRNFFHVNIEDKSGREIDGLRVHQVAFEEQFDPTAIFRNAEMMPAAFLVVSIISFAVGESVAHAIDL